MYSKIQQLLYRSNTSVITTKFALYLSVSKENIHNPNKCILLNLEFAYLSIAKMPAKFLQLFYLHQKKCLCNMQFLYSQKFTPPKNLYLYGRLQKLGNSQIKSWKTTQNSFTLWLQLVTLPILTLKQSGPMISVKLFSRLGSSKNTYFRYQTRFLINDFTVFAVI